VFGVVEIVEADVLLVAEDVQVAQEIVLVAVVVAVVVLVVLELVKDYVTMDALEMPMQQLTID
jgi:hypothetical protein